MCWKSFVPGDLSRAIGFPVSDRLGGPLALEAYRAKPNTVGMNQTNQNYLKHHFLIAMPHMADPRFANSLIYLCDHNEEGAMGLVINHPSDLHLADILEQLQPAVDRPGKIASFPVYHGGPVQTERGFVLHRGPEQWEASLDLGPLQLTTSRDILLDMAHGIGPSEALLALGYAGWDAGQLDQELAENMWLSCPADTHILFELPSEERLLAAARSLGIDLHLLTSQAGHA